MSKPIAPLGPSKRGGYPGVFFCKNLSRNPSAAESLALDFLKTPAGSARG